MLKCKMTGKPMAVGGGGGGEGILTVIPYSQNAI